MPNVINLFPRPPSGSKDPRLTLLHSLIETAQLAGSVHNLSLSLLCDLLESAPRSDRELVNDDWAARSFCWRCLLAMEERFNRGEIPENVFDRLINFWVQSFAVRDAGLKNRVLTELKMLAEAIPGQSSKHPAVLYAETHPLKIGIDKS